MTEEEMQIREWAAMVEGDELGPVKDAGEGSFLYQLFVDVDFATDEYELEYNFRNILTMSLVAEDDSAAVPNRIHWNFESNPYDPKDIPGKAPRGRYVLSDIWQDCDVHVTTSAEFIINAVNTGLAFDQLAKLLDGDHFEYEYNECRTAAEFERIFEAALASANAEIDTSTENPVLKFTVELAPGYNAILKVEFEQPGLARLRMQKN